MKKVDITTKSKRPTLHASYKVIDDFIPPDKFDTLHDLLIKQQVQGKQIPWYYIPNVTNRGNKDWRLFYLSHIVYDRTIISPFFDDIISCCEPLNFKALIRIKCNMYPNTEKLYEHGLHTDYKFSHNAGILSINTCDGYTKLEDGTKIDSVANRMLLFDGQTLHTSSNTTDQTARININFNYF